ncbi:MAG: YciI family protein [Streptosporangiaceae bacterium]
MTEPQLVSYQVVLLRHTAAGRNFDEETRERIFREHFAYTLSLLAGGDQLAAGPVDDGPAEVEDICGLGVYQKDSLDEVRRLIEQDPGVQQGLYRFDVMTWRTAPGTVTAPAAAWVRG